MLVYSFVEVPRPFAEAAAVLSALLGGLSEAADVAYREGEELRAQVGIAHPRVSKTVRLRVGEPISRPDQTTIPLHWEAIGGAGLFPAMDADLTLAKLGPRSSHLSFSGSYEPPLGSLGAALDRTLHRIAEATVKRFTDRLGAAVAGWPPEPPVGDRRPDDPASLWPAPPPPSADGYGTAARGERGLDRSLAS